MVGWSGAVMVLNDEARRHVDTAIDWGRYAELFAYDDDTGEFTLEEEASLSVDART